MKIILHQTHHTIADFDGILRTLENDFSGSPATGLHLYPELFFTGYPLQDLCIQQSFIEAYHRFLKKLGNWSQNLLTTNAAGPMCILAGGLHYDLNPDGTARLIRNVIYQIMPGERPTPIYTKRLLPSNDIFDEPKYFTPGNESGLLEWDGERIGLLVCEDMWARQDGLDDPCRDLIALRPSVLINISASPYTIGKHEKRQARAHEISQSMGGIPFVYVNRVGGEDELIFDGRSFALAGDSLLAEGPSLRSDTIELDLSSLTPRPLILKHEPTSLLPTWDDATTDHVIASLRFGIREYAKKTGFQKFLVALSGGIDSTVVLTLAATALEKGESIEALYMPGMFSAGISFDLSFELCQKLGIKLHSMPIKFLHTTCKNLFMQTYNAPLAGLADENIQSRLRGLLLYSRSNMTGAMVLNTSNKSELAVGYSTLYGDSVGAISPLGDVYKTEVYRIAERLNQRYGHLIPEGIIRRAPSAELRENQEDSQSLPPYERLDAILECVLGKNATRAQIVAQGHSPQEVDRVIDLYQKSEYKRMQFCPILKIRPKSFGFGHRVPICKHARFYFE